MKKVRRISGASKNEYFMGTDYTYDDMGDRNVDEDTHTLLGEEQVDGRECWKVESIPVDPEDMYTRKVLWIDKISYLTLKGEYYDKDGLIKKYHALDVRQQDGIWQIFRSEMDNVSREHKTIMEISKMEFDTGVDDKRWLRSYRLHWHRLTLRKKGVSCRWYRLINQGCCVMKVENNALGNP